ncbi:hypothetical protein FDZ71_14135, partial [bacterium]
MLRFVEVSAGDGAPVACRLCVPAPPATYRPADGLIAEIASATPDVSLVGAEPFNHPELPEVVAAAVRAGAERLRVETAGAALARGDNAAGALAAGVRHVRLVLLGDEGAHDSLTGMPGSFAAAAAGAAVWTAAAARSGARTFLGVLVPVCPHNAEHLPAAVAAAARLGAREVVLRVARAADPAALAPWLVAACDTGAVNRVWVRVEPAAGVAALMPASHALHLTPALPREAAPA